MNEPDEIRCSASPSHAQCPECERTLQCILTDDRRAYIECEACDNQRWYYDNERWHKAATESLGSKFDTGKLRWGTLMPWEALTEVVKVLEHGAVKYEVNNWQIVPGARERYLNSGLRHLIAYAEGEKLDPDTELSHMAHLICNALFLLAFDIGVCPEPPDEPSDD